MLEFFYNVVNYNYLFFFVSCIPPTHVDNRKACLDIFWILKWITGKAFLIYCDSTWITIEGTKPVVKLQAVKI